MEIGPYRVVEEIARGGMGVVYRAQGPDGALVAIKLVLQAGLADPEDQVRFRREAEALATLDHPGILRVHSHGIDAGRPYMVMELLPGPTLAEAAQLEGRFSEAHAIQVGASLAAALGHAHARGVVHRDLKPANVILRGDEPVLVDFGLVLVLDLQQSRLTETGTIMGSPHFMAPEQARGETHLGPAADLYGLGATLYFLLTGKPPFEGKGVLDILARVASDAPLPLRQLRAELSPALEAVVMRCLEKDPSQRYPTAFALEQALSSLSAPSSSLAPQARSTTRGPWKGLLAAGLLAGVASVALFSAWPAVPEAAGPQLSAEERAQEFLDAGKIEVEEGRFAEALEEFDKAIELDPGSSRAYASRAIAKTGLGRKPDALQDYDTALELDPGNALMLGNRGALKSGLRRYNEALKDFDTSIELDPSHARIFAWRGKAHMKLGNPAAALSDLDAALELNPSSHASVRVNRGACLVVLGRYAEAIQDCDRALTLQPRNARAYAQRGYAKVQLGKHDEGLRDLNTSIELDPNSSRAYGWRGTSLEKLGRYAEALLDFDKALALGPRPAEAKELEQTREAVRRAGKSRAEGYAASGLQQTDGGLYAQAIESYTRAIELGLSDPRSYGNRGYSKAKLGRHAAAVEDYDSAIALEPDPTVYLNRAGSKASLGRYAEAIEDCDKALQLNPSFAAAYSRRGDFQGKLEHYKEAIKDYEEALRLDPRNAPAYYLGRGSSKMKLERYAQAIEDFNETLRLDPSNALAYTNRGGCKASLGRYAEAIEDYDRALRLEPRMAASYSNRAFSKVKLGHYAEAIRDYDEALARGLPRGQAESVKKLRREAHALLQGD